MAESSFPTPSNGRAITEAQYEKLMAAVQASGLVGTPALPALVYGDGSGRQVKIRANRAALLKGRYWESGTTETTIPIAANSTGAVRRDMLVLGLSRTSWNVSAYVKLGSTTLPALTQDVGTTGTYEIPLAQVNVAPGATSLASGDVVPLAWYLSTAPLVCTSTSRPPATVGGLLLQVVSTTVGPLTTTTSTLYVGVPATSGAAWQALVTSGTAPLGTYAQYLGSSVADIPAPSVHQAMPTTGIAVLPARFVRISARCQALPDVPSSATLNILLAGVVYDSSGRRYLPYTTHAVVLDAEYFFRTAPNQTQLQVGVTIELFPGASATKVDLDVLHVNVTDHGPIPATGG